MSRVWRQIGTPGLSSPRPNRQSNTSQLGAPYHVPSASGSISASNSGRINVVRPPTSSFGHVGGLTRDPYGYTQQSLASSRSESPAGFWMTSPSNQRPDQAAHQRPDQPHLPNGTSHDVRDGSFPSDGTYMTYDDNLFVFKYSSDGDTTYPTKSAASRTKSWNESGKESGPDEDDKNPNLREFFQETGFDGLKHAGDNRLPYLMRGFWAVVVCLALAGLLYQVTKSIKKYSEFPTNTKYEIDDNVKYIEFPAVTFCNVNMFRSDKLATRYENYQTLVWPGLAQLRQLFPQMGVAYSDEEAPPLEQYPGEVDLRTFIMQNSHDLKDMIVECSFNNEPCTAANFTLILTNYGVCYTYNQFGDPIVVNQAGQRRGLSLILNTEQKLYTAAPRENVGFKMLAHSRKSVPPNMDDRGKELEPGTHVAFGLELTEVKKLDSPYGKGGCNGDDRYTSDKCFLECETNHVVEKCQCRSFYMPGDAPFCSPQQIVNCVHKTIDEFNYNRQEVCTCKPACKQTHYKASLSQSAFPSANVASILHSSEDWEYAAAGFGDLVSLQAIPRFESELEAALPNIVQIIATLQNSKGVTFQEFTSPAIVNEVYEVMTTRIFSNIPYDIYDSLGDHLFYDCYFAITSNEKYEYIGKGSDYYWEQVDLAFASYVESNYLWEALKDALNAENGNTDVGDEYVTYVYDQFHFETMFYGAFNVTFETAYDLMKDVAVTETIPKFDINTVATEYIRLNLLYVDVFFEELKLEKIEEQIGYEFFQMICDIGGALGLFFGASLLSFIEIFTFCSTRKYKPN